MSKRLYTEQEDTFILENYRTLSHKEIATILNRSIKSIRNRARKIDCERKKSVRRWTSEEDDYITKSKGLLLTEVAKTLNRDISDVSKRARKLGFNSWRRPEGEAYTNSRGYVVSGFDNNKMIYEHRVVVEKEIGRKLESKEIIHHIDLDKTNNKPSNLYLCAGPAEHLRCHMSLKKLLKDGENAEKMLKEGIIVFDRESGNYFRKETQNI